MQAVDSVAAAGGGRPRRRWLRRSLIGVSALLVVLVIAGGTGLGLALTGHPVACGSGDQRGIGLTELRSTLDNLRNIRSILKRVNFPEQVVTIAAEEYDKLHGDRYDELKVGFCGEHAEASATRGILSGVHIKASANLTVDDDGLLRYEITSGEVGSLPGWLSTWLVHRFEGPGWIDLKRDLTGVEVGEGTVTVTTR